MERGELVIIMENSGPLDTQDFYGRVGEYLFTDYGSAVVEIMGTSTKVLCKPENLIKVSAVPRLFEAISDALEWLQHHGGDALPTDEPGLVGLIANLEAAINKAQ
jgi:hypothetical protein